MSANSFMADMGGLMRKIEIRAENYQEINRVYEELENIPPMVLGLEELIGEETAESINGLIRKALETIEEERDRWSS